MKLKKEKRPKGFKGDNYVICHAHYDNSDDYLEGHIPGAIFGNCGTCAYLIENYRNPDLTMRAFNEVSANWAEAGVVTEKHSAFYCGTAWRGNEAFLNAWLMGWPNVSVYDGGWFECSNDPSNPFEIGEPVKVY